MTELENNLKRAQGFLRRWSKNGVLNHIDGKSVPAKSGQVFANITPVDLSQLCYVARGGGCGY